MDSQSNAAHGPLTNTEPENRSIRGWLRENAVSLLTVVAMTILVCVYLNPLDVFIAIVGLGGIVFLHELGHFLAAKACDVHVKTFSVGFGPALPFCSFKYGETTYKLALIPLGGFVAMVGEGEPGTPEGADAKTDPRSFKNKSVPQRMLVISAGVIMNLILGAICFIVAYMHGIEESPAIIANVDPGSTAWRAGMRPGERMTRLNDMENIWFDDIRPIISGTSHDEEVTLETEYQGQKKHYKLKPIRPEGAPFPQLGVAPPSSLTLFHMRRDSVPPFVPGSTASKAKPKSGEGSGFLPGDTILATTDPDSPTQITPFNPTKLGLANAHLEYQRRLIRLAGQEIVVRVQRKAGGEPIDIVMPPAFQKDLGLRMRMGMVTAIRTDSPADRAGILAHKSDGEKTLEAGDIIVAVAVPEPTGGTTIYSADSKEVPKGPGGKVKPLDPLRLPFELNKWAQSWSGQPTPNRKVQLTVLREIDHTQKPLTLDLEWDDSYREHFGSLSTPGSPVPLGGLGLAYQVLSTVDRTEPGSPAAQAGLLPGDTVKNVRIAMLDANNKEILGKEKEVGSGHWAMVDYTIQSQPPHKVEMKIDRGGQEVTATLTAVPDLTWAVPSEGLLFMPELETLKADSVGEALHLGARRTVRAIRSTYIGLYGLVFGRVSLKMISGPITLARASYILAGQDIWKLILLVAIISINLAVVNFLPIPVLDGGHMVFLLYEGIFRRPPPIYLHNLLTYLGLLMVLCMMFLAVGLDIWRLITR